MGRPTMDRRNRIRVEFGLPPDLAEEVYKYAKINDLTLSRAGARLLTEALAADRLAHEAKSLD